MATAEGLIKTVTSIGSNKTTENATAVASPETTTPPEFTQGSTPEATASEINTNIEGTEGSTKEENDEDILSSGNDSIRIESTADTPSNRSSDDVEDELPTAAGQAESDLDESKAPVDEAQEHISISPSFMHTASGGGNAGASVLDSIADIDTTDPG